MSFESDDLPFDRVTLGAEELSVDAFMQMPFHRRVRAVLARDVRFFAGETEVDRRDALRALRGRSALT